MVLTYCHPDVVGGAEWQARILGRALVRRGHEVVVFATNPDNSKPRREEIDGMRIVRIPSLMIAGRGRGGGIGSPIMMGRYAAAIIRERPRFDVLHGHIASYTTGGAVIAAALTRTRVIVKLACSGPPGDIQTLDALPFRAHGPLIRRLVRVVRRVIVLTDAIAQEARAFGFADAAIVRIPNGVEIPHGSPPDGLPGDTRWHATEPGRSGDRGELTIVSAGRLNTQKRFDLLIEAVALLRQRFPVLRAVISGEGDERPALESLIALRSLGGIVTLPGRQEPKAIYASADLFVLPSDDEGMSNVLLEAMARGLPCVVSDIEPNRETAGDAAHYFRRGDPSSLAETLARLLDRPVDALRLGARARARALSTFSIDLIAEKYDALYTSLAAP